LPGLEGLETVGESLLSSGVRPRFRGVLAGLETVGKSCFSSGVGLDSGEY
jgi:hypothetical protein